MFAVLKLNFRSYNFTTKQEEGNALIFDIIRKKYVRLTPEEWVRQHVIAWLTLDLSVPPGLISVERMLVFNGLKKRFDVCVADRNGRLCLLVECKAPGVRLGNSAMQQAAIYRKTLGVDMIFLSNGLQHVFLRFNPESLRFELCDAFPPYPEWF